MLVINELAMRGHAMLPALGAACIAGRAAVVLLMYRQRYARDDGLGNLFIGKVTGRQSAVTLGLGALLCLLLIPAGGIRAYLLTLVGIFALGLALKRTLGGQTGDTLGAAIELGELFFLLALL